MAQCHNVRGEDGPCDCAGCQEVAALRQRVEELERENRQQYEQLRAGCTCGSGGHPNRCEKHPRAYQMHVDQLDYEHTLEERAEAAEAKLARCVEALHSIAVAQGKTLTGDMARDALAATKGGE